MSEKAAEGRDGPVEQADLPLFEISPDADLTEPEELHAEWKHGGRGEE